MPTVRENIAYTFEHFMLVYRGTLLKVARAVAVIALVALALEVFVFNINFFTPRCATSASILPPISRPRTSP